MCGEHTALSRQHQTVAGSSPRVRGTRQQDVSYQGRLRFIPACAGNTLYGDTGSHSKTVHPRVCGEHGFPAGADTRFVGSSPRVRGTPGSRLPSALSARFIPACAGNTPTVNDWRSRKSVHPRVCGEHVRPPPRTRSSATVHPRVCGEHEAAPLTDLANNGSSPRVRGTPRQEHSPGRLRRFIPACAGNTQAMASPIAAPTVHPRVCGEHHYRTLTALSQNGSSPRVRGTHHVEAHDEVLVRFIPACAGNTPVPGLSGAPVSVHPRVCGEHISSDATIRSAIGSSPRVRGTLRAIAPRQPAPRFIPACAGNTGGRPVGCRAESVHPRVCGEHAVSSWRFFDSSGSSPRVRGTHEIALTILMLFGGSSPRVRGTRRAAPPASPPGRFIPACAGNTKC